MVLPNWNILEQLTQWTKDSVASDTFLISLSKYFMEFVTARLTFLLNMELVKPEYHFFWFSRETNPRRLP